MVCKNGDCEEYNSHGGRCLGSCARAAETERLCAESERLCAESERLRAELERLENNTADSGREQHGRLLDEIEHLTTANAELSAENTKLRVSVWKLQYEKEEILRKILEIEELVNTQSIENKQLKTKIKKLESYITREKYPRT